MAFTHRFVSEWTAERFLNWASTIDEVVRQYLYFIFEKKEHEEQAYKSCLGVLNMEKQYGKDRLINACKKGIEYEMYGYKAIEMILKRELDKQESETQTTFNLENVKSRWFLYQRNKPYRKTTITHS